MTALPKIANPPRKPYPSDLSDAEWEILKPLLPKPNGRVERLPVTLATLPAVLFSPLQRVMGVRD